MIKMNQMSRIPDNEGKIFLQNHGQFTITHGSHKLHTLCWPRLTMAAINSLDSVLHKHMDKATSKVTPGPISSPGVYNTQPADKIWSSFMEKEIIHGLTLCTGNLLYPCLCF